MPCDLWRSLWMLIMVCVATSFRRGVQGVEPHAAGAVGLSSTSVLMSPIHPPSCIKRNGLNSENFSAEMPGFPRTHLTGNSVNRGIGSTLTISATHLDIMVLHGMGRAHISCHSSGRGVGLTRANNRAGGGAGR